MGILENVQFIQIIYLSFQELITRSSLESHKLDLMAEISSLKIRLATAENDRRELEERLRNFQVSSYCHLRHIFIPSACYMFVMYGFSKSDILDVFALTL